MREEEEGRGRENRGCERGGGRKEKRRKVEKNTGRGWRVGNVRRSSEGAAGCGGGAGHAEEERGETAGKLLKKDARQRRRGAEKHHAILQALLENGCVPRRSPPGSGHGKMPAP